MHRGFVRGLLLTSSVLALIVMSGGAATAADSDPLIELLQSKGVISANDAAGIERAPAAEQRDRLIELLRAKGVITASDAASIAPHVAEAAPRVTPSQAQMAFAGAEPITAAAPAPVQPRAPHRAPVAHAVLVSDVDDGGIYEASARNEPPANALSFKVGGVSIYPGASLAMTSITRGTTTGAGIATNFSSIPFENTVYGAASETRMTVAGTILDLRAITDIGPAHLDAYFESDFNGGTTALIPRLRLGYVDTTWGSFELMFGQAYSWLTPNRVGLGPDPSEVFLTRNIDESFTAGLTWMRSAQVRVAYHPTDNLALGIGIENPDPFTGGEVSFPQALNAQLAGQFDNGSGQSSSASRFPDVVGKIAFDTNPGGEGNLHAELTGLLTSVRATTLCPFFGTTSYKQVCPNAINDVAGFVNNLTWGEGFGAGVNWQVLHNLNLIANGFDSEGGGRFIGNLGPDAIVRPLPITYNGMTGYEGKASMVRSYAFSGGAEWKMWPGTEFDAYYSAAYFQQNYASDLTSTALNKPNIGFGYPAVIVGGVYVGGGSPNYDNRLIQEVSGDLTQDFWSDPTFGVVQLQTQISWLNRRPWFVAAGAPRTASVLMGFVDLRLLIP